MAINPHSGVEEIAIYPAVFVLLSRDGLPSREFAFVATPSASVPQWLPPAWSGLLAYISYLWGMASNTASLLTDQCYVAPQWASRFPALAVGQSTRHGGVSQPPYASLNVGCYTDDDPVGVQENRRRLAVALGFDPAQYAGSHQVHGDRIKTVTEPGQWEGYDALTTDRAGILLSVTVADCVPILLYDAHLQVLGAVHAGWRGTVAQLVAHTVAALQQNYGTQPQHCWAYIGTCIGACDFAVDADVGHHFSTDHQHWDEAAGKFFVDLKAANRDQLLQAGLLPDHIELSPYSTVAESVHFFSHRADQGRTGRGLGLIGLRHP